MDENEKNRMWEKVDELQTQINQHLIDCAKRYSGLKWAVIGGIFAIIMVQPHIGGKLIEIIAALL